MVVESVQSSQGDSSTWYCSTNPSKECTRDAMVWQGITGYLCLTSHSNRKTDRVLLVKFGSSVLTRNMILASKLYVCRLDGEFSILDDTNDIFKFLSNPIISFLAPAASISRAVWPLIWYRLVETQSSWYLALRYPHSVAHARRLVFHYIVTATKNIWFRQSKP